MTEREALQLGTDYRANSWKAFLFVLPYLRPHLRRMLLVCLIDISIVVINLTVPWFGKSLIDTAFPQRDLALAIKIAAGVAGMIGVSYCLTATRNFLYNTTEVLLGLDLRRTMYRHLQSLSLETVESLPVGQQQFRISTDSDRIAHMLVRILPTLTMLVEFALILAAAITVDPILTGLVLALLVPWTILFVWVTHYGRVLDRRRLRLVELRDAGVIQAASSFATIKSLGRSRREVRRHSKVSVAAQRVANQGYLILVGFEFATQKLIPFVKTTTIYLYLAQKVILGQMTLGMTVPMIAYLGRLSFPIERIVNFGCWIWQTMVSAERMMQIMQVEPAIKDRSGAIKVGVLQGSLELKDVTLERLGVGRVLDSVSMLVEPGKTVAIVGPSGAGKSSLLGLFQRLYDPVSGEVLIDDTDIKHLDRPNYLRRCGSVMQSTFIFGGSLADNLRIAKPDATDEELLSAIREVELNEWFEGLPSGLDEDLESGSALSAGQKQRIGVARALLANGQILLLDEPTSALDAQTETELTATLRRVSLGKTVIWVTHRLDTVVHADEIIVLNQGRIEEQGTHKDLIDKGGLYADLRNIFHAVPTKASAGAIAL